MDRCCRIFWLLFFATGMAFPAISQQGYPLSPNYCGVKASFTPGNDSVISSSVNVQFVSTSTNATLFNWYINGLWNGTGASFTMGFGTAGLYEVKLVAQNGSCSDTALCYYFFPGSEPADRNGIKAYYGLPGADDHSTSFTAASGGGYLMGGYTYNHSPRPENGLLIKTAESGCIEWSKTIEGVFGGRVYKAIQLSDQSYLVSGYVDNRPYLLKTDPGGNPIWGKAYAQEGQPFINAKWFHAQLIAEADDGGFVLAGPGAGPGGGITVMRTDAAGNIAWCKMYQKYSSNITGYSPWSILQKGQDIYISGGVSEANNINTNVVVTFSGIIMKINDATGETRWTKKYQINGTDMLMADLHFYNKGLLANSWGGNPGVNYAKNSFHFLDTAGNMLNTRTISTAGLTFSVGNSMILPAQNDEFYIMTSGTETLALQPGYAYHSLFMRLDAGLTVKWSKEYGHYGGGRFMYPAPGQQDALAIIGDETGSVIPVYSSMSAKIKFKKIDASGGNNNTMYFCGFGDGNAQSTATSAGGQPFSWSLDSVITTAKAADTVPVVNTVYSQVRYVCPGEFVDSCSFMRLSGPASICSLSDIYTYSLHRNRGCHEPVSWQTPSNATVINQTDSSVTLQFNAFGTYTIAALLPFACTPVKDSMVVQAVSRTAPLNLGPDTSLCPGNSLVLHASPKFMRYTWQDGSVDSVLTVTGPGQYRIEVHDSCDNILRDTVNIAVTPPAPIDIGPDRVKCNNDTLHFDAPPGFLRYTWSPAYAVTTASGMHMVANPLMDTAYYIMAEKTPGCFGFDTVRVTVYHSLPLYLGRDTSFCAGDSILLNAGSGFAGYQWSNGAAGSSITVKAAGKYSVIATTADGCRSYDTLQVANVFAKPVVALNHSPGLCMGENRVLDAGDFAAYNWNTGNAGRTIIVSSIGFYRVRVTDRNNCSSADSVSINSIWPLPAAFLPPDTAICAYQSLNLQPYGRYKEYLWSTGASSPSIAAAPGTYWLQVTDDRDCRGSDTIVLKDKGCPEGVYIPTAFRPGSAGNNVFRPLIHGFVQQYEFTVFNRYGQVVFMSTSPGKGWDGYYKGQPQNDGVFIWTFRYQFAGKQPAMQKGTVILLR